MTREEAVNELELISEDTVQRECSTCGRLHIGTYSGICALCSLCECVPDYAKEYHKKYKTVSRWKWNGRWDNEALDMAISSLKEQPRWISVDERLPERKTEVLCFSKNAGVFVGTDWVDWPDGKIMFHLGTSYDWPYATHWMPLPEPPEVEV